MSTKEQYWRYSLITIILLLGVLIFLKLRPFLGGLLGALTIYVLLRGQMFYLVQKRHLKRSIMAILILAETVLFFLIPLSLIIWMFVKRIEAINLEPRSLIEPIEHIVGLIHQKTGYNILSRGNIDTILSILPQLGRVIMGSIGNFVINVITLLFVLYFMLIGGKKMEIYVCELLPFNKRDKRDVLHEFYRVVRSNAIGVPLLAIIQGAVATLGYYIFGAPQPILWGIVSAFASIIPIVGTAIVWVPLGLYIGATGHWGSAIGLALYGMIIVSNTDNLTRFMLQKKLADTHPLITVFGVIIGLSLFGFMGVIFGPLMLAIFVLCVQIFKEEYLDTGGC